MVDYALWKRAQDCIAQGALTNSKHPSRHIFGVYPTHVTSAYGCTLITPDGHYEDYICGLGANLFGYNNPKITEAILGAINKGFSHSLPTVWEIEAGEALKECFYFVDKWKFLKSGSEACSAAIKIARAKTGRDLVLSEGYHGWHDAFVTLTEPALGCHRDQGTQKYSDDYPLDNVAAVIVEPIITDYSEKRIKFLQDLRERCTKSGTLLIFDEVITGFRFPSFCVSQHVAIFPDLLIIGKAMANGLPLAAVGGKTDIMDGDYFISTTYAGEILSLAATKRVCEILQTDHMYNIKKLWEDGEAFIKKFNQTMEGRVVLEGYPTRGAFVAKDDNDKFLLFQEAAKAHILLGPSWFYNWHLKQNDFRFFQFLKDFKSNLDFKRLKLEGVSPKPAFAEKVRKQ